MALAILIDVPVVCLDLCRQILEINMLMGPQLLPSKSLNYYCGYATPASFQIFSLSFTVHSPFMAFRGTTLLLPQIDLGC
jgi:hypothetical protein